MAQKASETSVVEFEGAEVICSKGIKWHEDRVSVQGVKSLGGHFACLCREINFYEVKKKYFNVIFQKEK